MKSGAAAAQAIVERGLPLVESLALTPAVGGYYPLHAELDPRPLLAALQERGFSVSLPRVGEGATLCFKKWVPGSALERGKLGVHEPAETEPTIHPSIVLVPLLAFDRAGNRLGYGAGYYDASLRQMRASQRLVAIGVAFDEQECPEIPREPQDEPLDLVLTPSRIIACGDER